MDLKLVDFSYWCNEETCSGWKRRILSSNTAQADRNNLIKVGTCVWVVGLSDVCDHMSEDQWSHNIIWPRIPPPDATKGTEKATCSTETQVY